MYQFDFRSLMPFYAQLPSAIGTTSSISLIVCLLSSALGVPGALARLSRWSAVRIFMTSYVEVLRNVPLLVVLYLVYFSVAQLGVRVTSYWCAVIALTLNSTAFTTEIFRAGIIVIPRGHIEAAKSLGLTASQAFGFVVAPQVLRIIYAPLGNQFVSIVLGSSLASVIGVGELTNWMGVAGSYSARYAEAFVVIGVLYLVICQAVNGIRLLIGKLLVGRAVGERHR